MDNPARVARIAGGLYLLTVVASIPALALKAPVLADPSLLTAPGGQNALLWASALELVLAVACVGTAVVLYPVARRQSETAALGFVAARVVEAALILVGVVAMLAVVTVPRGAAAVDGTGGALVDAALVGVHDWAFLIGPGLIPVINALCLGWIMYHSRLVPRTLPILGFIGAPLLLASATATLFGVLDQVSTLAGIAALPIAAWEIGLGAWLLVKGFRTDAVARLVNQPTTGDTSLTSASASAGVIR